MYIACTNCRILKKKNKKAQAQTITCYKMAAATTRSLIAAMNANTASPTVATMLAFLQAATTVFSAAWSEHEDVDDDDNDDAANLRLATLLSNTSPSSPGNHLRAELSGVTPLLSNETNSASDDSFVPLLLLQQCRKLGSDIVLRLDHLAEGRQRQEEETVTGWSLEDLVVLGERLDTLIQRVQDLENCPL